MLDQMNLSAILRQALAGGGEFAEIYFEEGSTTAVLCEDGNIEKVLAGTDRGVGIGSFPISGPPTRTPTR